MLLKFLIYFSVLILFPLVAGDIELLRYLISKGVDVDSQSDAGPPLIWAAGHGQQDAVKVLLEHHANVRL